MKNLRLVSSLNVLKRVEVYIVVKYNYDQLFSLLHDAIVSSRNLRIHVDVNKMMFINVNLKSTRMYKTDNWFIAQSGKERKTSYRLTETRD